MKIWRYWVSETRPLTSVSASGSSCVCNFRVTAGSDRSEEEARARLEDIFQELANWNARQCGDEDVAEHRRRLNELHGYFEDGEYARPICERVLSELDSCNVVTRNRYGAEVLNSSDTCFVDIDHVRRTFGEVVRGWVGGPVRPEDVLTARIEALLSRAENRDLGFRLYKTRAGWRLIVDGEGLEPGSPRMRSLFKLFNADYTYERLCISQQCYRARLTPKPWRIGMQRFAEEDPSWLERYESAREGHAVCRFVCERGRSRFGSAVQYHDERTGAAESLPLG